MLSPRAGEELAVTTDLSIDGRHFCLNWHQPEAIGHRVLARGLSDLAAMGARPVAAFLSLGLPRSLTMAAAGRRRNRSRSWMQQFLDGFLALAGVCKTPLAGGDLAESNLAVADVVLVGAVARGRALLRSGARTGDLLYVTGALGGAAAGLARLVEIASSAGPNPPRIPKNLEALLAPHLYPQPRIAQGLWLQRRGVASAAIDLATASPPTWLISARSLVWPPRLMHRLCLSTRQQPSHRPFTAARTMNCSSPLPKPHACPEPSPAFP